MGGRELTARERRIFLAVCGLYAAVALPIGIHKGGDLEMHLRLADGLIHGQPPYGGDPGLGVWWPPFAILAVSPFALLARASLAAAKGLFALLSVACLAWSVAQFARAGWRPVVVALAAVAVPLETNFEYLNLNAVLLALVVAAGRDLGRGREGDARAGVWLGVATALKVFPGLLLVYAAYRRRWRAAEVGAGVAAVLTVGSLLPLGPAGAVTTAHQWLALSEAGGWVPHRGNQSLPGFLARAGVSHPAAAAIDLLVLIAALAALSRPDSADDWVDEAGIVTLVAVLLSPIAWSHYYLLAFPAWVAAGTRAPPGRGRGTQIALLVAAIATSGALTVWSYDSKGVLLEHSIYVWGALVLLVVLLAERRRRASPAPVMT